MNQTASNPIVACLEKEMPEEVWGCINSDDYWWGKWIGGESFRVAFKSEVDAWAGLFKEAAIVGFLRNYAPHNLEIPGDRSVVVETGQPTMGYVLLTRDLVEIDRRYTR